MGGNYGKHGGTLEAKRKRWKPSGNKQGTHCNVGRLSRRRNCLSAPNKTAWLADTQSPRHVSHRRERHHKSVCHLGQRSTDIMMTQAIPFSIQRYHFEPSIVATLRRFIILYSSNSVVMSQRASQYRQQCLAAHQSPPAPQT